MRPNDDNGGRWDHIASQGEIALALADNSAQTVIAESIRSEFIISHRTRTIVRASEGRVQCGWVYGNTFAMFIDVCEIRSIGSVLA